MAVLRDYVRQPNDARWLRVVGITGGDTLVLLQWGPNTFRIGGTWTIVYGICGDILVSSCRESRLLGVVLVLRTFLLVSLCVFAKSSLINCLTAEQSQLSRRV